MYFSKDWGALVETSFRNFLREVVAQLPLPTLLRFNADRLRRQSLQRNAERLTAENAALQRLLGGQPGASALGPSPAAASLAQPMLPRNGAQPALRQLHQRQASAGAAAAPAPPQGQKERLSRGLFPATAAGAGALTAPPQQQQQQQWQAGGPNSERALQTGDGSSQQDGMARAGSHIVLDAQPDSAATDVESTADSANGSSALLRAGSGGQLPLE